MSQVSSCDFIRNAWYVAGLSEEIGRTLLGRTILDEPVVLYRTEAGEPIALFDACSHRHYPLSQSRLIGDRIECGYHGFTFDCRGDCVEIPSLEGAPSSQAAVRSYVLHERYGRVWIWMGDPAKADAALIPSAPWLDAARTTSKYIFLQCHYQLLIENLLDFSHVPFVHHNQQGHRQLASMVPSATTEGRMVVTRREMTGAATPPLWHRVMGLPLGSPMDHKQRFEFHPPSAVLIRQELTGGENGRQRFPFGTNHFMTPAGSRGTHYWWTISLEWDGVSDETLAVMHTGADDVALQDKPVLEAQQMRLESLADCRARPPVFTVPSDRGAMMSRRTIARLLAEEAQPHHAAE